MQLPPIVSQAGVGSRPGEAAREGEGRHARARRARGRAPAAAAGADREGLRVRRARPARSSLVDLFEGRRQLILYHFMFGPNQRRGLHRLLDGARPDLSTSPTCTRATPRSRPSRARRSRRSRPIASGWAGRSPGSRRSGAISTTTSSRRTRARPKPGQDQDGETFGLSVFVRDGGEVYPHLLHRRAAASRRSARSGPCST